MLLLLFLPNSLFSFLLLLSSASLVGHKKVHKKRFGASLPVRQLLLLPDLCLVLFHGGAVEMQAPEPLFVLASCPHGHGIEIVIVVAFIAPTDCINTWSFEMILYYIDLYYMT